MPEVLAALCQALARAWQGVVSTRCSSPLSGVPQLAAAVGFHSCFCYKVILIVRVESSQHTSGCKNSFAKPSANDCASRVKQEARAHCWLSLILMLNHCRRGMMPSPSSHLCCARTLDLSGQGACGAMVLQILFREREEGKKLQSCHLHLQTNV